MKANKKILAGVLALTMGLCPIVHGIKVVKADQTPSTSLTSQMIDGKAYIKSGENWLKTKKNLDTLKASKEEIEQTISQKKDAIGEKILLKNKYKEELKKIEDTYKDTIAALEKDRDVWRVGSKFYNEADEKVKEKVAKRDEETKTVRDKLDLVNLELESLEKELVLVSTSLKNGTKYTDKENNEVTASFEEAIKFLESLEKEQKEAFIKEGATEEAMKAFLEADEITVPEEQTQEYQIKEKIKDLEKQLGALDFIKTRMPETTKKYQKQIDNAIKKAQEVLKKAKAYIEKLETEKNK